jgi:hypothetical protein
MKRFCTLGWCATLVVAVVAPRPGLLWSLGALLFLGFTLALIVLFVGFLGRRLGARGRGTRWALLVGVVLLPTVVLSVHRLNPPSNRTRIEGTIEAVTTSHHSGYCDSKVTAGYLEQMTGVGPPFSDDFCEAEAGRTPATSVEVTDVTIADDRATALVANEGGPVDGSTVRVRLVRDSEDWKLDRLIGFEHFDRASFERAYRRLFLRSGAPPSAADCGLEKTRALSKHGLERALLGGKSHRIFARFGVACDREGTERSITSTVAEPKIRFPPTGIDCVAQAVGAATDGELVRLQLDLVAYNELLWRCDRAAVLGYLKRGLAAYDDLSPSAVNCVLGVLRNRPRVEAIRLTYDKARYERLIESCRQR